MTDLMIEARNALDVLAVLTETRPGNVRLNALDTLTRALKTVRADAQALADVRTLDAWRGPGSLHRQWEMWYVPDGENDQRCSLTDTREGEAWDFDGATPDEARAKAAAWVREQAKGAKP